MNSGLPAGYEHVASCSGYESHPCPKCGEMRQWRRLTCGSEPPAPPGECLYCQLECPDCPAEIRITTPPSGARAMIAHLRTCPWWRRLRETGTRIRILVPCGTRVMHRGPYQPRKRGLPPVCTGPCGHARACFSYVTRRCPKCGEMRPWVRLTCDDQFAPSVTWACLCCRAVCPDCTTEIRVSFPRSGAIARMAHASGCPWWRRFQVTQNDAGVGKPFGFELIHRGPYRSRTHWGPRAGGDHA